MSEQPPFFSVITATYNSMKDLPVLVDSLREQSCQDFEWIVQDGLSKDDTATFLTSCEVPSLDFASAKDAGIYDAFNTALDRARGRYVIFMGSDDRFADGTVLERLQAAIESAPSEPALVLGNVRTGDEDEFASRLGRTTLAINSVHHQGALYARSIFDSFRYDLSVPVIADYELNVLLQQKRISVLNTSILISQCGADGISRTSNEYELYRGMHSLRRKHVFAGLSYVLYLVGVANVTRRRILRGRGVDA